MAEHARRPWLDREVCTVCFTMPESGRMVQEPWPCPAARLAAAEAALAEAQGEAERYREALDTIKENMRVCGLDCGPRVAQTDSSLAEPCKHISRARWVAEDALAPSQEAVPVRATEGGPRDTLVDEGIVPPSFRFPDER